MATLLIIMVILLVYFKEKKLRLDLGGIKNNNIILIGCL
jgi:hypothetical protein